MILNLFKHKKMAIPGPSEALPGRSESMPVAGHHTVLGTPTAGPWPEGHEVVYFGLGCFWGAERKFWQQPGVHTTAVGYQAGLTPNPTYKEVCTGMTGHNEVVLVVYDPRKTSFDALLKAFWENHDPTQGMRQGNDVGSQYRSLILCADPDQFALAEASRSAFSQRLAAAGFNMGARVWNLQGDLTSPLVLGGHRFKVWGIAFSPDSRRVVTSGSDRTLRIRNLETPDRATVLDGHDGDDLWSGFLAAKGVRLGVVATSRQESEDEQGHRTGHDGGTTNDTGSGDDRHAGFRARGKRRGQGGERARIRPSGFAASALLDRGC